MEKAHDAVDGAESMAVESPVSNAFRFTVMRAVRLALTLVCEVLTVAFCIPVGMSAFMTAAWGACLILAFIGVGITSLYAMIGAAPWPAWTTLYYDMLGQVEYRNSLVKFLVFNPYIVLAVSSVGLMFCWGQALAFGLPYRYKNTPPGLMVVRCGACHKDTPNDAKCVHCEADRFAEYAVLKLLWVVNVCISSLWGVHDLFAGFAGMVRK